MNPRQPYDVAVTSAAASPLVDLQTASENEKKLCAVIAAKGHVFITYRNDGLCCDVSPHRMGEGREGVKVHVMDHMKNGDRSFFVSHIMRMEDSPWESTQGNTHTKKRHFFTYHISATTEWLQEFGMEKYAPVFEQNGYDTLHIVSAMDESDLDALGITIPAHRKLFLFNLKDLCKRLNC
jgi:hypothetical protein